MYVDGSGLPQASPRVRVVRYYPIPQPYIAYKTNSPSPISQPLSLTALCRTPVLLSSCVYATVKGFRHTTQNDTGVFYCSYFYVSVAIQYSRKSFLRTLFTLTTCLAHSFKLRTRLFIYVAFTTATIPPLFALFLLSQPLRIFHTYNSNYKFNSIRST